MREKEDDSRVIENRAYVWDVQAESQDSLSMPAESRREESIQNMECLTSNCSQDTPLSAVKVSSNLCRKGPQMLMDR